MTTQRRTLGVHSQPRPLGPNGEKLCFNCRAPLPKGRPYNCSSKCSEEWTRKTSPAWMRYAVFNRDHGICALCGLDTMWLYEYYRSLVSGKPHELRVEWLNAYGIPPGRVWTQWWDADHIIPVIEGGGQCNIDNFRTLCLPCHHKETKELHARMKSRRIEAATQTMKSPKFGDPASIAARNYLRNVTT